MAKKTLLQMTQDILNDLDSDEVNSIDDTVESTQVAQIIRSCYEEMMSNRNWPHQKTLLPLVAVGTTYPNYLQVPDNTKELISVKYNVIAAGETKVQFVDIPFKPVEEFLDLTNQRNTDNANVDQIQDFGGTVLLIINDKRPEYWTTFDDEYLVFDSYDSAVDSALQSAKSQAVVYVDDVWTVSDDFIPNLPSDAFSALIEEAKSTAFLALKQMANQKAEQKATRQQRWLSRKAWKVHGGIRYPNYGRK